MLVCIKTLAPLNNTGLWHDLGTKRLDFRHENNSTSGILIEEIRYVIHRLLTVTTNI